MWGPLAPEYMRTKRDLDRSVAASDDAASFGIGRQGARLSIHWRIAGLVLATIAFVATLAGPAPTRVEFLADVPLVAQAGIYAVSVFVAVWLYEGLYRAVLRVGRALFPPSRTRGGQG